MLCSDKHCLAPAESSLFHPSTHHEISRFADLWGQQKLGNFRQCVAHMRQEKERIYSSLW